MKIYFAGSIRGGRQDKDIYLEIIKMLGEYGTVLTEHIGDQTLTHHGEQGVTDQYIYERDLSWLLQADAVVAEVSVPSLGVGYEIGRIEGQKPVLCLYRENSERKLSVMLGGNKNVKVAKYKKLTEARKIIQAFFTQTFKYFLTTRTII